MAVEGARGSGNVNASPKRSMGSCVEAPLTSSPPLRIYHSWSSPERGGTKRVCWQASKANSYCLYLPAQRLSRPRHIADGGVKLSFLKSVFFWLVTSHLARAMWAIKLMVGDVGSLQVDMPPNSRRFLKPLLVSVGLTADLETYRNAVSRRDSMSPPSRCSEAQHSVVLFSAKSSERGRRFNARNKEGTCHCWPTL